MNREWPGGQAEGAGRYWTLQLDLLWLCLPQYGLYLGVLQFVNFCSR